MYKFACALNGSVKSYRKFGDPLDEMKLLDSRAVLIDSKMDSV